MNCPFCGADTRVTDSRSDGIQVRRRRQCKVCEEKFTTYEVYHLISLAAKDRAACQLQAAIYDLTRILEEMKGDVIDGR